MITNMLIHEYNNIIGSIEIIYGNFTSPFGICSIAAIDKPIELHGKVCFISFRDQKNTLNHLCKHFKKATFLENNSIAKNYGHKIFYLSESPPLFLKGTELQIKTWNALLNIKAKESLCYEDIAKLINRPKAFRAVANAIGRNPISYLVPCHRIIRKDKTLGGYRWGIKTKQDILNYEASIP